LAGALTARAMTAVKTAAVSLSTSLYLPFTWLT
jgi:hypothetical protein